PAPPGASTMRCLASRAVRPPLRRCSLASFEDTARALAGAGNGDWRVAGCVLDAVRGAPPRHETCIVTRETGHALSHTERPGPPRLLHTPRPLRNLLPQTSSSTGNRTVNSPSCAPGGPCGRGVGTSYGGRRSRPRDARISERCERTCPCPSTAPTPTEPPLPPLPCAVA